MRLLLVAWLTFLWLVLWRDLSIANLASGVALAVVAIGLFGVRLTGAGRYRLRPAAIAVFVAYFLWKLVEANVVLAREVLTRRDTTRTGIIAVELRPIDDVVMTVIANSVSLTPGTLTLETRSVPPTLYVHVLHLHDPDRVRRDVHRLEQLVCRAFGLPDHPARPARPDGPDGPDPPEAP